MNYICLNGEILPRKFAELSLDNRAFRYGEGIVEEMRSSGIRVPFFGAHFMRLSRALDVLGISYLSAFNEESLRRSVELLIHRKKLYKLNKVRIMFWREDDEAFLAKKSKVQYLIEAEALEEDAFTLNEHGLTMGLYAGAYKGRSLLSPYLTLNQLFNMQATRFARAHQLSACLIANAEGNITEAHEGNVFFVNGKTLYTPGLESGCVVGIMRNKVLEIAKKKGYIVMETAPLSPSFMLEVEEIFLANDVYGIRWVVAYKERRYRRRLSVELTAELNRAFEEY